MYRMLGKTVSLVTQANQLGIIFSVIVCTELIKCSRSQNGCWLALQKFSLSLCVVEFT